MIYKNKEHVDIVWKVHEITKLTNELAGHYISQAYEYLGIELGKFNEEAISRGKWQQSYDGKERTFLIDDKPMFREYTLEKVSITDGKMDLTLMFEKLY